MCVRELVARSDDERQKKKKKAGTRSVRCCENAGYLFCYACTTISLHDSAEAYGWLVVRALATPYWVLLAAGKGGGKAGNDMNCNATRNKYTRFKPWLVGRLVAT